MHIHARQHFVWYPCEHKYRVAAYEPVWRVHQQLNTMCTKAKSVHEIDKKAIKLTNFMQWGRFPSTNLSAWRLKTGDKVWNHNHHPKEISPGTIQREAWYNTTKKHSLLRQKVRELDVRANWLEEDQEPITLTGSTSDHILMIIVSNREKGGGSVSRRRLELVNILYLLFYNWLPCFIVVSYCLLIHCY